MIRYTIKLALRLALLVAALFALGFLTAHVASADDRTDPCNPLTYGRPNSCHVAPVERSIETAGPDLLDSDTGYGRAAVYAWSRGYHNIGVVATYSGHAVVRFTIDCRNGYYDRKVWDDTGPKFRYHRTVPAYTRCSYSAIVRTNGSYIRLGIGAW